MHDEAAITSLLQEAGFEKSSVKKVELYSVCSSAKEAANGLVKQGPIYDEIKKQHPSRIDEIKLRVEKELAENFGEAPLIAPMSALISQAWK